VVVGVQAYRLDGKTLTQLSDPSFETFRSQLEQVGDLQTATENKSTDELLDQYGGAVHMSTARRYDVPARNLTITATEVTSNPFADFEDYQNRTELLRDAVQNLSYAELQRIFGDDLSDENVTELRNRMGELSEKVDEQQQLLAYYRNALGDDDAELNPDDPSQNSTELKAQIRALEASLESMSDQMNGSAGGGGFGAPAGCEVSSDNLVNCDFEFSGELDPESTVVNVRYADGTTDRLGADSDYWRVESQIGGDSVVVEDYPLPDDATLATVDVLTVSDDGRIGRVDDRVRAPGFSGDVPALQSVNLNTLRPNVGDPATFTVAPKDAGVSVDSVTVTAPHGTSWSPNVTTDDAGRQTVSFTPDSKGRHAVELTLNQSDGQFVERFAVSVGGSNVNLPPGLRVVSGNLGTFAVVGDGFSAGQVDLSGQGATMTAVVPDDGELPGTTNFYAAELDGTKRSVDLRVLRGDDVSTASSINRHVAVSLHTKNLPDDALVHRETANRRQPIAADRDLPGGSLNDSSQGSRVDTYTEKDGTVTVDVNTNPGTVESLVFDARVFAADLGVDVPGLVVGVWSTVADLGAVAVWPTPNVASGLGVVA
jgi:hypothetical protein